MSDEDTRCPARLMGKQCELPAGHDSRHRLGHGLVWTKDRPGAAEEDAPDRSQTSVEDTK